VLPGNHVDIILTQTLAESAEKKRSVGETILTNVRVIAVDQALSQPLTRSASAADGISQPVEARMPKTVTLEVTERQAEKVFVALQMGALQLSVRPLELASETGADDADAASSATWSYDVSAAVKKSSRVPSPNSGSTLEAYIRRPPAS
jgi:pilus assembly protein CpaB